MNTLTEEMCLVGGNGVDHRDSFRLLFRLHHEFVVLLQARELPRAQAAREAAAQQRRLGFPQPYSGFLVNEALKLREECGTYGKACRFTRQRSRGSLCSFATRCASGQR